METFVLLFSVGCFNGSSIWNVIITVSSERLGNPDVIHCLRDNDVGLVLPSGQIYAASFLCFCPTHPQHLAATKNIGWMAITFQKIHQCARNSFKYDPKGSFPNGNGVRKNYLGNSNSFAMKESGQTQLLLSVHGSFLQGTY